MENLNNVPSSGTYGAAINEVNANFSLVVNAINSLEYATTKSKGIYNNGFTPSTTTLPNSVDGDWCMVLGTGNTFPARIWTFNGTTWSQGGQWNPDGLDLTGYATTAAMNTAIDNGLQGQVGYAVCNSNGSDRKDVVVNGFKLLASGGALHIKMVNVNTAANATMNISPTSTIVAANTKPLFYNGAQASSENTWGANEIISVYYDGTNYQATNSQGGGGKAEKIKYDNTESGLNADNVQDALDEMDDELTELGENIYANTAPSAILINGNTHKWTYDANAYCRLIPITAGRTYLITAGIGNAQYTFLTSNSYTQDSSVSTWATGYTNQLPYTAPGTSVQVTAPSDANYLYILCSTNGTDRNHTVQEVVSKFDNIDTRLSDVEEKLTGGEVPINIIPGSYWSISVNRAASNSAYSRSDAIPVSAGQIVKVSASVGGDAYCVWGSSTNIFDINNGSALIGNNTEVTDESITIQDGINYIFISSRNTNFTPPFTPSASFITDVGWLDEKIDKAIKNKALLNPFKGLKLVTLGDSITHGQVMDGTAPVKPFPVLVAEELGMNLVNYGIGGSTIGTCANYGGTFASMADFNAATKDTTKYYVVMTGRQTYSDYRYNGSLWVTTTIAMRTPLVDRYDLMDSDADIILVAGGTNDFQYNWAEIGEITDNVKTTFRGALNVLCNGLITKYPQKCIIFMTPIKRCQTQQAAAANSDTTAHRGGSYGTIDSQNNFGKTLKEYGDIIKEMCARYSIPIIDMYAECMLNPQLSAQSSLFDSYKTHPFQGGHNLMARLIVGKLKSIFGMDI